MRNFIEGIQRSGYAGAVVGIWVVALIAVAATVHQGRVAVEAYSAVKQVERIKVPEVKVVTTPLGKSDYDAVASTVLRLHPGMEVHSEPDGVVILSRSVGDFNNWRLAVLGANQMVEGAIWKPETLCVGAKCPDAPYKVKLSAYRATARVGEVRMK